MGSFMMLVSARADGRLRDEVTHGCRPCPEYLRLEEHHGVELLDWSRLKGDPRERSTRVCLAHARAALRRLQDLDAVFSDGEHVGVPLALGMRARRLSTPHLMLGHHLTTKAKGRVFRLLRPQHRVTRILVHSRRQIEIAVQELGIPREKLAFVPYGVDEEFWSPRLRNEEALVVAVGREHRDYTTLARACRHLPVRVFVAAGSLFSPSAAQDSPAAWPANFQVEFATPAQVRDWYARAAVVVVPLLPNDFQAGVTVILEAMAMAKAVVVTATAGQRDVIENGVTGVMVPPGDEHVMREVMSRLLELPAERRRLGANARDAVLSAFSLNAYAGALAGELHEIARGPND